MMDAGAVIAIILLILPFVLGFIIFRKSQEKKKLQEALKALEVSHSELIKQNELLSPYQHILDAYSEAKKIIQDATTQANDIKNNASDVMNDAVKKAEQIIIDAQTKANEIAGSAIEAKNNAEEYKRLERSMRNIIKGYGNEYLVPNISLLDDLADEFSHKEAGESLKQSRAHTRSLVKAGQAAECDYAEQNRKETAIQFVTDAFNGKVDSILSKVKHDNYGKLRQEIEDAYRIVNNNGLAFRNARISSKYLTARMEELKWAVAANELKKIEQEEQRMIKEAMREEEKARREYEKAVADAEKEEKMIQKAMEEARKHLDSASQEERARYEQQLSELQEKLAIAEEKNQRALSMAQQTRSGHVYVISNIGSFGENVYKIGMTRRLEPMDRVNELGDASVPFSFDVHAMIHSDNAPTLEKTLHKTFIENQINKVNPRKEFFNIGIADIKKVVEEMGIEIHWTMVAEAREYHESKALKHPIAFLEEEYNQSDDIE